MGVCPQISPQKPKKITKSGIFGGIFFHRPPNFSPLFRFPVTHGIALGKLASRNRSRVVPKDRQGSGPPPVRSKNGKKSIDFKNSSPRGRGPQGRAVFTAVEGATAPLCGAAAPSPQPSGVGGIFRRSRACQKVENLQKKIPRLWGGIAPAIRKRMGFGGPQATL